MKNESNRQEETPIAVSLNNVRKFILADDEKQELAALREMIAMMLRSRSRSSKTSSGGSYWSSTKAAYRRWAMGLQSASQTIRALENRFGINDPRVEQLKRLIAGDRLKGSSLLSNSRAYYEASGFRVNCQPDVTIRQGAVEVLMLLGISAEGPLGSPSCQLMADMVFEAHRRKGRVNFRVVVIDVATGEAHHASKDQERAQILIRNHFASLRDKWERAGGTSVA